MNKHTHTHTHTHAHTRSGTPPAHPASSRLEIIGVPDPRSRRNQGEPGGTGACGEDGISAPVGGRAGVRMTRQTSVCLGGAGGDDGGGRGVTVMG